MQRMSDLCNGPGGEQTCSINRKQSAGFYQDTVGPERVHTCGHATPKHSRSNCSITIPMLIVPSLVLPVVNMC